MERLSFKRILLLLLLLIAISVSATLAWSATTSATNQSQGYYPGSGTGQGYSGGSYGGSYGSGYGAGYGGGYYGGYNSGPYNGAGYNNGRNNSGPYNGSYNTGGYNGGAYNNGYNNGGNNNGGYNNGGYNNGSYGAAYSGGSYNTPYNGGAYNGYNGANNNNPYNSKAFAPAPPQDNTQGTAGQGTGTQGSGTQGGASQGGTTQGSQGVNRATTQGSTGTGTPGTAQGAAQGAGNQGAAAQGGPNQGQPQGAAAQAAQKQPAQNQAQGVPQGQQGAQQQGAQMPNGDRSAPPQDQLSLGYVPAYVPPSAIERALAEAPVTADMAQPLPNGPELLSQFGYNFFRPDTTGFAPLADIPVGPEYVIGAGDSIIVTLWGSIDGTFELFVNRSGEVILPKVGSVKVAGQTFEQLPGTLKACIGRVYKDFRISVTMGMLRTVKVYVVGEVTAPGDYNLTSLSTVINALGAAGGPTKNGSLRKIEIRRNGKVLEKVDLYDFFLTGDKGKDIRLQAGDTVFVPVIGPTVGVSGNVRRPGIYELKGEQSLKDVLHLADGINPNGYLQRVQIYRVEAHNKKVVTDLNLELKEQKDIDKVPSTIKVQDLDLVKVLPIDKLLHDYVRVVGHVLLPGNYALKPEMKISDLLQPDKLLPEYYATSGQLIRLVPPDLHPEIMVFDLGRAMQKEPEFDLKLKEFDTLRVFSKIEMEEPPYVMVGGEVQMPGMYRLFPHMKVRDLVQQSGNVRLTAFLDNAEITRLKRSGSSVTAYSILINLSDALKGGKDNIELEPFDELIVRRIPNWAEVTDRYITLSGEFVFPGTYPIYKGERLSSVIKRAGGFTQKAYLPGAKFTRVQVQMLQQKRMDEVVAKTETELNQKQAEIVSSSASKEELEANKAMLDAMVRTLNILKTARAEGRVVIKLSPPEKLAGGEYDLEVAGGDSLDVPANPQIVSVLGQVYNPTSFVYRPGADVGDYVKTAGGTTRLAEDKDIYVIKADGNVESRQQSHGFLGFGGFMSKSLDSGDTVVVPQQMERTAWMRSVKDITTILSQMAVTMGVIIAAGL